MSEGKDISLRADELDRPLMELDQHSGPEAQGPTPNFVILGFRDQHGYLVLASSELLEARYRKHFVGTEEGPELRTLRGPSRAAVLQVWNHMVGVMFRRFTQIRGDSFEDCLRSLGETWRP